MAVWDRVYDGWGSEPSGRAWLVREGFERIGEVEHTLEGVRYSYLEIFESADGRIRSLDPCVGEVREIDRQDLSCMAGWFEERLRAILEARAIVRACSGGPLREEAPPSL